MRKSLFKAGIGLAVGGSLLVTTTILSLASGPSGYETLKSAVKNTKNIENATLVISGKVTDNQKDTLDVSSTIRGDHKDGKMSGTVNLKSDKTDKTINMYADENGHIINVQGTDTYYKIDNRKDAFKMRHIKKDDPGNEQIHEKILDAVVGDLKNQVKQENSKNGDKILTVKLDKGNIPEIVDLMLSLKHNKAGSLSKNVAHSKLEEILGINESDIKAPELVDGIKANELSLEVIVDKNNIIKEIDAGIDVTGKDVTGKTHDESLVLNAHIDGVNATKVDAVNLDGKKVQTLKPGELIKE